MSKGRFGDIVTAMVTPFTGGGAVDLAGARALAARLIESGSSGLVVCGTTGESPALSHDEKLDLFEAVASEAAGRAVVIAGTGTANTAESILLTQEAGERGADAVLVVTPYYNKPAQNALVAHFETVADASAVPVMLYDVPSRTSRRIERATTVRLARHDRIVAIKDAGGDAAGTGRLRADLDAAGMHDFDIYCGDDVLLLPQLAAGAVGVVSVCSHLVGPHLGQLFAAWHDGKIDEARRIYLDLLPLVSTIMGETTSPVPVKAALNMLDVAVGPPRLPLLEATPEEKQAVRAQLEAAGLLA